MNNIYDKHETYMKWCSYFEVFCRPPESMKQIWKKNVNKYKHIICKLLFWSLGLGWAGQRCLGPQKYGTRINKKTTHNTKHTLLSVYNKHICAKIYVAASGYADTYLFMHRNWYFHNTYQYLCINNDILTTHVFVCMQVIGLVKM